MHKRFAAIFGAIIVLVEVSQGYVQRDINHDSQVEIGHHYQNGNECEAPNNEGVNGVIKEKIKEIPVKDILDLSMKRIEVDPEVRKLAQFFNSENFRNTLSSIEKTKEYIQFVEYACKNFYWKMGNFWNLYNSVFDLPNPDSIQNAKDFENIGIKGFFKDIIALIPVEKLKEIFIRREKSDEYVRLAIDRLKSDEFRQKMNEVRNLPEYTHLAQQFTDVGLPLNEFIAIVREAIGWVHAEIAILDGMR